MGRSIISYKYFEKSIKVANRNSDLLVFSVLRSEAVATFNLVHEVATVVTHFHISNSEITVFQANEVVNNIRLGAQLLVFA
jgi:hypothetical protein